MTDFREKSTFLEGVSGTFSNAKAKVKEDSEGKLQLHRLYLLCTLLTSDSCYQTKNKRKNNPGVSINMNKLKISNTSSSMRTLY